MNVAGITGILRKASEAERKEDLRLIVRNLGRDYEELRPTLVSLFAIMARSLPE